MSPTETDRRISSKLGDFSIMKQIIDRETSAHSATSHFIGVNTSQNIVRPSSLSSSSSQQQQVFFFSICDTPNFRLKFLKFLEIS